MLLSGIGIARMWCCKPTPIRLLAASRQVSTQPQTAPSTSSSNSATPDPRKPTHYRVTLFRSPIGLPKPRRDSLVSLGLRRRMDVTYHRHSPDAAGLILSVKELLKVENVTEAEVEIGRRSSRTLIGDDRGYRVLRNVLNRE